MRLRLFSVDVFWLTACWIVVWSMGSPFHPALYGGPCWSATLVNFGSSKGEIPFFFFFPEAPTLTLSSESLVPTRRVRENLLISSVPVACSKSQNKSAELETGLLHQCSGARCCDFSSERMEKSQQLCRSHLLTPGSSGAGSAAGGSSRQSSAQWWDVLWAGLCDAYSRSLKSRYRLNGKMSQRVKPQACGIEGSSSALGCFYFPLQTYRECAVSILLSSHFSTLQLRQVVPRTSFLLSNSTTVPGRASSGPWWSFLPWQCSCRGRDFWRQILHRQISMQSWVIQMHPL